MTETTLHIPAIDCEGCIKSIERIVQRQGAALKSGDPDSQQVTITYDEANVDREELIAALADADFAPAEA